jgi:cell division protein FtsB
MAAARPLPATPRTRRPEARKTRPARRPAVENHRTPKRRMVRRRTRLLLVVSVVLVGGSLFAVAAAQALVAAHQVSLDRVEQSLSSAVARNQNLEFALAKLESPARIIQIAEGRYGMVVPESVVYLAPVNPGLTVNAAAKRSSR